MVESILTFFAGCAVTGALVGCSVSVYLYFSADLRSVFPVTPLQLALTGPIVVGITAICFGTIPFMCVAAVLRKVWSPVFLKRGGFVTGLLFGPGFLFGHFIAARRHGVGVRLPYFVPQFGISGTGGAYEKMHL